MATEQIIVEYKAQVEGFKAELKSAVDSLKKVEAQASDSAKKTTREFQSAGSSIKETANSISLELGLAFGTAQVIAFAKESVKAFLEAEVNANKLRFAVTKIGGEGETAFRKLIAQSEKLQDLSIFSDDDIQNAQTQLSTLGLTSQQIQDLIPKVLDLASATGQDLGSATQSVIQGINGQTRGLKSVGLAFDATSDKTKNLSLLSEGLTKFQGATAEALQTTTGKAQRLNNAIDNIKESLGEFIVNQGTEFLDLLDSFSDGFDAVNERRAKAFAADKFAQYNDAIIEDARKSEKRRLELIEESDKKALTLQNRGYNERNEKSKKFIAELLINENKLNSELRNLNQERSGLGLDQDAIDKAKEASDKKKEDALKAEKERIDAIRKLNKDAADQFLEDTLKEQSRVAKEKESAAEKETQTEVNIVAAGQDKIKETKATSNKQITEADKKADDERKANQEAAVDFIISSINAISELQSRKLSAELEGINEVKDTQINALQQQLDNRIVTQEQFDQKRKVIEEKARNDERKVKQQQFEAEKQAAIIQAIINTAVAASKVAGNPVLLALAIATGALQVGLIESQPTPKFAKGVVDLQGKGTGTSDSIHAMLSKGESVVTADATSMHKGLLEAMNKKQGQKYIDDFYIAPILRAQLNKNKESKDNSFASNIANSLALHSSFKDGNLLDSLKQSRRSERDNFSQLIKVISNQKQNKRNW